MRFCNEHYESVSAKNAATKRLIVEEYQKDNRPWYVGFSGGKDSSALLVLLYNALLSIREYHKNVVVVYCDTGVEIPPVSRYVHKTLSSLRREVSENKLPMVIRIARPVLDDRYFVKVIGRGYPPPTNIFRWCTDRLRIAPVQSMMTASTECVVLLGVRRGESSERDRVISRHLTGDHYYLNQKSSSRTKIFGPIVDYNLRDIWSTLMYNRSPKSVDFTKIGKLYREGGTECPIYREEKGTPCGKGRFGCWTCTVVRKDQSVSSMIGNGYKELEPLFNFRNWLADFREDSRFRCYRRRNGSQGPGPITLRGRRIILARLLKAQERCGLPLISNVEIHRIKELWRTDRRDSNYIEEN